MGNGMGWDGNLLLLYDLHIMDGGWHKQSGTITLLEQQLALASIYQWQQMGFHSFLITHLQNQINV